MELELKYSTNDFKDWVRRRIQALSEAYPVFDWLQEHNIELPDKFTDFQIQCPFPEHGPDNSPSARYYAQNGGYFHCFKCKHHFTNSAALLAQYEHTPFMDALSKLERRFKIKIPQKPEEEIGIQAPGEKDYKYKSEKWSDVSRLVALLEKKLMKLREKTSLIDFVKFCRVLDSIQWDLSHNGGQQTYEMVLALQNLKEKMELSEIQNDTIQ